MQNKVKPKKSSEFSQYVAIFVSVIFTTHIKGTVEDSFTNLQELSFLLDLGLYLIIFSQFHYFMSKFTEWIYSAGSDSKD